MLRTMSNAALDNLIGDIIDLVHIIYPEDCYVAPDVVLGWAHDALINESVQDHVNAHGPFEDNPAGEQAYALIAASVSRPVDLGEAKSILSDLGTHTFGRD